MGIIKSLLISVALHRGVIVLSEFPQAHVASLIY